MSCVMVTDECPRRSEILIIGTPDIGQNLGYSQDGVRKRLTDAWKMFQLR